MDKLFLELRKLKAVNLRAGAADRLFLNERRTTRKSAYSRIAAIVHKATASFCRWQGRKNLD